MRAHRLYSDRVALEMEINVSTVQALCTHSGCHEGPVTGWNNAPDNHMLESRASAFWKGMQKANNHVVSNVTKCIS